MDRLGHTTRLVLMTVIMVVMAAASSFADAYSITSITAPRLDNSGGYTNGIHRNAFKIQFDNPWINWGTASSGNRAYCDTNCQFKIGGDSTLLDWTGMTPNGSKTGLSLSSNMQPNTSYWIDFQWNGTSRQYCDAADCDCDQGSYCSWSCSGNCPNANPGMIKWKSGTAAIISLKQVQLTTENTPPSLSSSQSSIWTNQYNGPYAISVSDQCVNKAGYFVKTEFGESVISNTQITAGVDSTSYSSPFSIPWGSLQEGKNMVSLTGEDCVGNTGTANNVFWIGKDISAPMHTFSSVPRYVKATSMPVTWVGSDSLSGIKCFHFEYKDVTPGGFPLDGGGNWTEKSCLNAFTDTFNATQGHTYWFRMQAEDAAGYNGGAGNKDTYDADGVFETMFDSVIPTVSHTTTNITTVHSDGVAGNVKPGNVPHYTNQPFTFAWSGNDTMPGSGVAGYNLQYKQALTIPGALDAASWTDIFKGLGDDPGTTDTSYTFTGTDGTVYRFQAETLDRAGNHSGYTQAANEDATYDVIYDTTRPEATMSLLPSFTTNPTVTINWSGTDTSVGTPSGIGCYFLQVSIDNGPWQDMPDLQCVTQTSYVYTFPHYGTYEFRVRARDKAANDDTYPVLADCGTVADFEPPVVNYVYDGDTGADQEFTNSANRVKATWSGYDLETGIKLYEYSIGTSAGQTDVLGWTSVAGKTSIPASLGLISWPGNANGIKYYVNVRATDAAGKVSQIVSSNGITIDIQAPSVTMSEPSAEYMGTSSFLVAWSGSDGMGESGLNSYTVEYSDNGGSWVAWKTDTTDTSATFTGVNGHTYKFRVKAKDNVGNISAVPADYHKITTVNTSNLPAPTGISDASTDGDDADAANLTSEFSAHWTAVDLAARYLYAVGTTSGGNDVIDWTSTTDTSFSAIGLALAEGTTYYTSVRAVTASNINGFIGTSDGVLIDRTAPACAMTALTPYQSIAAFSVQWGETGTPDISGIKSYDIQYKAEQTGAWTDHVTNAVTTSAMFSGVNGGTYYFRCRATDNAGNTGNYSGGDDGDGGTKVDTSMLPYPATITDGSGAEDIDVTADKTSLAASWSAVDGAASYEVCFASAIPDNCSIMDWVNTGTTTSYQISGLSLVDGETYYVRVKAINFSGMEGSPGNSTGVLVDSLPPAVDTVTDAGQYTKNTNSFYAEFTSTAGASGIAEYSYAIGTTAGGNEIKDWASNQLARVIDITTETGLPQLAGNTTYYISVKARSRTGVWSAPVSSDGIFVDTTPPACSVSPLQPYQSTTGFSVSWSGSDSASGLSGFYTVQVKDNDGSWTAWKTNTTDVSSVYTGENGHTYGFRCKAMDNVGNQGVFAEAADTQTLIMTTPPAAPVITDGTSGDDLQYTSSATTLAARWDTVPNVQNYDVAVGTAPGGSTVSGGWQTTADTYYEFSTLSLTDGVKYYISVKARSLSGILGTAGSSNGVIADSSAPPAPVVTTPDTVSSSLTRLRAGWTASDPHSGIAAAQVSVGTTPGGTDVSDWRDAVSNGSEESITGLSLQTGTTYYINVKVRNITGLWSEPGSSPGVRVDDSLLQPAEYVYDGTSDDIDYTSEMSSVAANWAAVPNAVSYIYAIGTTESGTDLSGGWLPLAETSVSLTSITIADGTRYYFCVKAVSTTGINGETACSDGVLADSAVPPATEITDAGEVTSDTTTFAASWTEVTVPSSISEYFYALGSTEGATDVIDWTSSGTETSVELTALELENSKTYYLSVKAVSVTGVEGAVATSDGLLIDNSAPLCVISTLGQYQSDDVFPVVWSSEDEDDVSKYSVQVKVGESANWIDWIASTTETTSEYDGVDGFTYSFRCKITDPVGNVGEYTPDPGVQSTTVASEPPAAPAPFDGTQADLDYSTDNTVYAVAWQPVPRAVKYRYMIMVMGEGDTDYSILVDSRETTETSLSITDADIQSGDTVKAMVWAVNPTDMASEPGETDGLTYDLSAPSATTVTITDEYVTKNASVYATFAATDPQSGIDKYLYAVGTTEGGTDVIDWTESAVGNATISGIDFVEGVTYYISAKARNRAGLTGTAGFDTVVLDLSVPVAPAFVYEGSGSGTDDIEYSSDAAQLTVRWGAVDEAASYLLYLSDSRGGAAQFDSEFTVLPEHGGAGAAIPPSQYTLDLNSIPEGTTLYAHVRAVSSAGKMSPAAVSDGVTFDYTAPVISSITLFDVANGEIALGSPVKFSAAITEEVAPISSIEYAIGTSSSTQDVVSWTDSEGQTTVSLGDITLEPGTSYYIMVRAANQAGLEAEPFVADPFMVARNAFVEFLNEDNSPIPAKDDEQNTYYDILPPPEGFNDVTFTRKFKVREKTGIGVTFDQMKLSYELENGTVISEPVVTASLEVKANADFIHTMEIVIPARVVISATAGNPSTVIMVKYEYTGTDTSGKANSKILALPVKITDGTTDVALKVISAEISNPPADSDLPRGEALKGLIKVKGVGTVSGMWMIDGEFYKSFTQDAAGVSEIEIEQAVPAGFSGTHTVAINVVSPQVISSGDREVFVRKGLLDTEVDVEIQGSMLAGFTAGILDIRDVSAKYDPSTNTWTGKGTVKLPLLPNEINIDIIRLEIEKKADGKFTLVRGMIGVAPNLKVDLGPVSVEITKVLITKDSVIADGSVTFGGTNDLPKMGPFYFYSAGFTEKGVSAVVKLKTPQKGRIGMLELGIDNIYFKYEESSVTLKTAGYISTAPDKLLDMNLYFMYAPEGTKFIFSGAEKTDWIPELAEN